jgi:mono/diheme cytochrome c family protein
MARLTPVTPVTPVTRYAVPAALAALLSAGVASPAFALDVDAAKSLAQSNNCTQCHGIKKDKDGSGLPQDGGKVSWQSQCRG